MENGFLGDFVDFTPILDNELQLPSAQRKSMSFLRNDSWRMGSQLVSVVEVFHGDPSFSSPKDGVSLAIKIAWFTPLCCN